MRLDLDSARATANLVRFRAESVGGLPTSVHRTSTPLQFGRRLGLEVSQQLTPHIFETLQGVCQRLAIEPSMIRAFVHPSADFQATCSIADNISLVELTSSIVESLERQEQAFVIGHELGHFLLDHHYLPLAPKGSLDRYSILRAREVSADRLGLIACGSTEAAIRAILKTFSGLSDRHLRFDAAAFIRDAFDEEKRDFAQAGLADTHPSFALRARCLVHFAGVTHHLGLETWPSEFERVDERVFREFMRFGEARVMERVSEVERNLREWVWLVPLVNAGSISRDHMQLITQHLGEEFAERVRQNFGAMSRREVADLVERQFRAALSDMASQLPARFQERMESLLTEAEAAYGMETGSHPARQFSRPSRPADSV